MVQRSEASAYFCSYLLNAFTKSNNFWHMQQFTMNTVLSDIYSYTLEGAAKMKQLDPRFLTSLFINEMFVLFIFLFVNKFVF